MHGATVTPAGSRRPPISIGLGEAAQHQRDHGAETQGLLNDRVEIGVISCVHLVAEPAQHSGMPRQRLERPRERGGARLVPGHEQRHQLVAQLLVGHRAAVVVARLEEEREHVVALLEVGCVAARADLLEDQVVGRLERPPQCAPLRDAARAEQRELRHPPWVGRPGKTAPKGVPEPLQPLRLRHSEDAPHDHLERDRLHRRPRRHRLAGRPALDLACGDLRHRLLVAAHAPAVERRQHQLALRHVGVVVEQQHRVAAEHGQAAPRSPHRRAAAAGRR